MLKHLIFIFSSDLKLNVCVMFVESVHNINIVVCSVLPKIGCLIKSHVHTYTLSLSLSYINIFYNTQRVHPKHKFVLTKIVYICHTENVSIRNESLHVFSFNSLHKVYITWNYRAA